MQEVDNITTFTILRSIGCPVPEEVTTVADLISIEKSGEAFVNSVLICLGKIAPDAAANLPQKIPRHMAQKVSTCSEVSKHIKDLGYKGELGYHHLIYPTENGARTLLQFLVALLPNDSDPGAQQVTELAAGDALDRAIVKKMQTVAKEAWSENFPRRKYTEVHALHASVVFPGMLPGPKSGKYAALLAYIKDTLPLVTQQPARRHDVVPSILEHNFSAATDAEEREAEWNTVGLSSGLRPWEYKKKKQEQISKAMSKFIQNAMAAVQATTAAALGQSLGQVLKSFEGDGRSKGKGSIFTHTVGFKNAEEAVEQPKSEEEIRMLRERELEGLEQESSSLAAAADRLRRELATLEASRHQLEANLNAEAQKTDKLKSIYLIEKKTYDLLPDAENNIRELRRLSDAAARRLIELATEWEKYRAPLVDKIRAAKALHKDRKESAAAKVEAIKKIRAELAAIDAELQKRDERFQQLVGVYGSLNRDLNRNMYTIRILEIVKNVKKQKVEIDKILIDTRNLKKDINAMSEQLGRRYSYIEELIYKDATNKKDPTAKQAYKQLVAMNENFEQLVKKIEEVGSLQNQSLLLEQKIEQVQQRTSSLNMERVTEDLKNIKKENMTLIAQLKSASAGS